MLTINQLKSLCNDKNIAITKHAKNRLVERLITVEDIKIAIQIGEIIEQYENDKPFPSCLILGLSEQKKPMHIVASIDNDYMYVITAYYPETDEWKNDFKTRKEH